MTGIIEYTISEEANTQIREQSSVLVRDVNETKIILQKNGNIQTSNGGIEFYKDEQGVCHFGKSFYSYVQNENLFVNLKWSYSSFASYIIKTLNLLENINTNKENKYFFGKVYDYPEMGKDE